MKPIDENACKEKIAELLALSDKYESLEEKIENLTLQLLGTEYKSSPLCGSRSEKERFVVGVDGFDCVTFVETVLALSFAIDEKDFYSTLKHLRYENGQVHWLKRNHYMSSWITLNKRRFRTVGKKDQTASFDKTLCSLENYRKQDVSLKLIPAEIDSIEKSKPKTGDIILFGSTRSELDYFHLGILIKKEDGLSVRHAAKSKGSVVDEKLKDFLARNKMSGVKIMRPL